jgi:hypothetical protein
MQLVDVLGDEGNEAPAALEPHQRAMGCVRFGAPGGRVQAVAPGLTAYLSIGQIVLQRGGPLGPRVAGPDTLRASEIGDARLGRDPRAGQDGDRTRLPDELAGALHLIHAAILTRPSWSEIT